MNNRRTAAQLTLGGGPLGNLFNSIDDDEALAVVHEAWAAGIRNFDTAPHYGLGLSERRLGAALHGWPRADYTVSTKVGRVLEPLDDLTDTAPRDGMFDVPATARRVWDFTRDGIRRSLDDSLERLGLDRVDTVYLHDPDDHFDAALTSGVQALVELRDEGVVGAIGVGMNSAPPLVRFVERSPIDVVMVAGRITLLDRSALDRLIPLCVDRGVAVVAAAAFNSGVLAQADPTSSSTFDYQSIDDATLSRVRRLAAACERHGISLRAAALSFPATIPAVSSVCFGARSAAEVRQNVSDFGVAIPGSLWEDLGT